MKNSTLKIIIVTSIGLGMVGFATAQNRAPTQGRIPEDAITGGRVDLDEVPDYVVAYARDGQVAGYVSKSELFGPDQQRLEVLDETLKTVVGHMVMDRGFVPDGVPEAEIPTFPTVFPKEN